MVSVHGAEQFSIGTNGQGATSIIEAIAGWCDSMAGNVPLRHGMRLVAEGLGAKALAISRVRKDDVHQTNTVIHDGRRTISEGPKLERSYAEVVMGQYVCKSKSGTLWYSSLMDGIVNPSLKSFQQSRRLHELVVIPIDVADRHVDFFEIHFADRLDTDLLGLLNMTAATLVRTWLRRANGLFSDAALSSRRQASSHTPALALLDVSNPAKLSRCEYRVCLLLSSGLHSEAIQKELNISRSTLRSHLRNIYGKTDCSSLAELTYKLLSTSALHPTSIVGALRKA